MAAAAKAAKAEGNKLFQAGKHKEARGGPAAAWGSGGPVSPAARTLARRAASLLQVMSLGCRGNHSRGEMGRALT